MKDFPICLQDKEVSYGAHAPRILALDDYFLMEVEKSEQDPDTGKKVKKKVSKHTYINFWGKHAILWAFIYKKFT